MSKYLITFEVDTDLDEYGEARGSNYDYQPSISADEVEQFAGTFGASPGSQWDGKNLPHVRTVSVEPLPAEAGDMSTSDGLGREIHENGEQVLDEIAYRERNAERPITEMIAEREGVRQAVNAIGVESCDHCHRGWELIDAPNLYSPCQHCAAGDRAAALVEQN